MLPAVIVVGALVRKWWFVPIVALLWPVVVGASGEVDGVGGFVGAGLLGAANAAIGAVIGSVVWDLVRRGVGRPRRQVSG